MLRASRFMLLQTISAASCDPPTRDSELGDEATHPKAALPWRASVPGFSSSLCMYLHSILMTIGPSTPTVAFGGTNCIDELIAAGPCRVCMADQLAHNILILRYPYQIRRTHVQSP